MGDPSPQLRTAELGSHLQAGPGGSQGRARGRLLVWIARHRNAVGSSKRQEHRPSERRWWHALFLLQRTFLVRCRRELPSRCCIIACRPDRSDGSCDHLLLRSGICVILHFFQRRWWMLAFVLHQAPRLAVCIMCTVCRVTFQRRWWMLAFVLHQAPQLAVCIICTACKVTL